MIPVHTARSVRALDHALIDGVGIPGRVLMETAGREAAAVIHARWPGQPVAVLCGPGNNGGDGYVVARWLKLWGHAVKCWGPRPPGTQDARSNRALLNGAGVPVVALDQALEQATVVVDALLGTGQRHAPQGIVAQGIETLRDAHSRGVPVVALDLPTGVCADTGQALGGADSVVEAALTVTFGAWKPGLLSMPGARLAGEVVVVDIGLALAGSVDPSLVEPQAELLTAADVAPWQPRTVDSHAKWDRGHVAILGGGGASVLAALGALAGGAGLVTVLAKRADWAHLHGLDPSVILAEPDALDPRRHDVLVIGPGLGITDHARRAVTQHWGNFDGAVVADADALTILAEKSVPARADRPRVLTPHAAEAGRLLRQRRAKVESDRIGAVAALDSLMDGAALPVLKGPHTLIGGGRPWISPVADGRLAVAGSGDVLAGVVGAALSRRLPARQAAAWAVWVHGHAADHLPHHGSARQLVDAVRQASAELG